MKKRAKKTVPAPQPAPAVTPETRPSEPISFPLRGLLFLAIICGYWMLFYKSQPARLSYWQLLLLPDTLWHNWTNEGGPVAGLDRVPIWLLSFWWITIGYAAGSLLLRWLQLPALTQLERFVFAVSLGLGGLSHFTLLLGLCGLAEMGGLLWLLAIGLPVLEWWQWRREPPTETPRANETPSRWFWLVITPLTAFYLLAGVLPPTEFDVREYHLQVPKEWFLAGEIRFLPHNIYGNMPLGAEMHALGCMELWLGEDAWWYGALAGKQVIALFAPLTALALWCAGRRFYNAGCGTLAAVVYLTFPWMAHVSFHGLIDGVVAHYAFLAIFAVLLFDTHKHAIFTVGLLVGCAAACKYPSLLFVAMPVFLVLLYRIWQANSADNSARWRQLIVLSTIFVIGCQLSCQLWYVKNWVFAENPVYPLAANIFGGKTRTPEKIAQWEQAHAVPRDALTQQRYSFPQLQASARQVLVHSEWLSPLLWPFVLLGVIASYRYSQSLWLCLFVGWMFAVWWFFTHRIDRFWLPAVPVLALLAGTAWLWGKDRRTRGFLLGSAAIGYLFAALTMMSPVLAPDGKLWHVADWRWFTPLATLRKEIAPAHAQLNSVVLAEEAVLLVGDATPFDLNMPVFYNTCFDDGLFESLTRYRTPEEIRQAFREKKIAYVLIDWSELQRYRKPGNYGYNDYVQPSVIQQLEKQQVLTLRWKDDQRKRPAWEIYEVK
jgi:hypothetical protein